MKNWFFFTQKLLNMHPILTIYEARYRENAYLRQCMPTHFRKINAATRCDPRFICWIYAGSRPTDQR